MNCTCPAATAIGYVDNVVCTESFGQIQKVAFTRLKASDGTKNSFTSTAAITALASWTAKTTAADYKKVVVTPYISAPTDDGGDARTTGGGNDTPGGVEKILGENPISFSGRFDGVPQNCIAQLKTLMCEAAAGNLGVFLFDENGKIEAIQDSSTATTYYPIPIRSLFIGSKKHGNFEAEDNNAISWQYLPNWSDNVKIVTPADFNPLTDLVNDVPSTL